MVHRCLLNRRSALIAAIAVSTAAIAALSPASTQTKERAKTMQYMIMVYEDESAFASRTGPEKEKFWGEWAAYTKALRDAGVMTSGHGLQAPATSTTIRLRDGKRQVQDGPFADTKEQLGGYYVIDVANLDAALDWAAKCPAASYGGIEVRPILAR